MDIPNPRRILAVALAESQDHLSRVIKDLTGAYPADAPAGTTQELALSTPYYAARVPVWLDLVGQKSDGAAAAASASSEGKDAAAALSASEKTNEKASATDANTSEDADEADEAPADPRQWADAFLADEAREVRAALGGVVAVVAVGGGEPSEDRHRDLVEHVGRLVREGLGTSFKLEDDDGDGKGDKDDKDDDDIFYDAWDGVGLVVGVSAAPLGDDDDALAAWDDACAAAGLEFILVAPGQATTNEFGEKTGIPRVLEALEANDWSQGDGGLGDGDEEDEDGFGGFQNAEGSSRRPGGLTGKGGKEEEEDGDDDGLFDPESLDFGFDRGDFAGLRQAIWQQRERETADAKDGEDEDDDDVLAMDRMMRKLLAVRDLGAGLPPEQRRRLAARAVGEVMREL